MRTIDSEVVLGAARGDKRHEGLLFDFIYKTVAGVLSPHAADLEDAAQEAWLRVREVVRRGRFDPMKPNPTAFLRIIVVNVALDQVRNRSESWRPGSGPQGLEECPDPNDPDPTEILDNRHLFNELMSQLDEDDSSDFLLLLDGLSMDQIAKALRIPVGTVKSRLSRAKRRMERRGARLRGA